MERIKVKQNIYTWGWKVRTFPKGIDQAFRKLEQLVPDGERRSFYGISYMENKRVVYYASVEKAYDNEFAQHAGESFIISSGTYRTQLVKDWREKTNAIKEVFANITENCPDHNLPAIEWYRNEEEMLCMVREVSLAVNLKPDL